MFGNDLEWKEYHSVWKVKLDVCNFRNTSALASSILKRCCLIDHTSYFFFRKLQLKGNILLEAELLKPY